MKIEPNFIYFELKTYKLFKERNLKLDNYYKY